MPRKRTRTTTKASWTVDSLENAVSVLKRGGISVYKVSQQTGIPYSTLKKRYNLAKVDNSSYKNSPKLGRRTVFNVAQEEILANHLRTMSSKFYGLTREQFRKVCYSVAKPLGIEKRFNQVNQTAGKDWLAGFLQRHPDLSIRKPEAISVNRIVGFNKTEITLFFNNLEKLMEQHNFEPQMIYNADETGVTTVQETERIIAPKGQKRVGSVTSWERGKTVTVICAEVRLDHLFLRFSYFPVNVTHHSWKKMDQWEPFTHVHTMAGLTKRYSFYGFVILLNTSSLLLNHPYC